MPAFNPLPGYNRNLPQGGIAAGSFTISRACRAARLISRNVAPARGDGDIDNWRDLRAQAAQAHNSRTAACLIGTPMLADYLDEAMEAFGVSAEDFEDNL